MEQVQQGSQQRWRRDSAVICTKLTARYFHDPQNPSFPHDFANYLLATQELV